MIFCKKSQLHSYYIFELFQDDSFFKEFATLQFPEDISICAIVSALHLES